MRFSTRSVTALALLSITASTLAAPHLVWRQDGGDSEDSEETTYAPDSTAASATSRLYFLDQLGGAIKSCRTDGSDLRTVSTGMTSAPDGIAVDKAAGYIYVSNMGTSLGSSNSGSIERLKLDGTGKKAIVEPGRTHTAKQLELVVQGGVKKLYWGDREGMRVMRCNVDGSGLETVVDTSTSQCAGSRSCKMVVGVAVDTENGYVYWSQKGGSSAGEGSIHRAPVAMKAGEASRARSDVETLLTGLPEPIDLHWVSQTKTLYWTDRSNGEGGNTVNRLKVGAAAAGTTVAAKKDILYSGLGAGIGIAVDAVGGKMWATDLRGNLWMSDLEGKGKRKIGSGLGVLVGIDYVE